MVERVAVALDLALHMTCMPRSRGVAVVAWAPAWVAVAFVMSGGNTKVDSFITIASRCEYFSAFAGDNNTHTDTDAPYGVIIYRGGSRNLPKGGRSLPFPS